MWIMDKDTVSTLTIQELSTFPLDEFFDHYEKGLRKVSSSPVVTLLFFVWSSCFHFGCFESGVILHAILMNVK